VKTLALFFDHPDNKYQRLLESAARKHVADRDVRLLSPAYAKGSTATQMAHMLESSKAANRPDAALLMVAGDASQLPACRHVLRAGVSLVFINRLPLYMDELREAFPQVLVAGVAPDQREIGSIQAAETERLAPRADYVLLITGAGPSAAERREGFRQRLSPRVTSHELSGKWTEQGAFDALSDWYRIGADRGREVGAIVCQNDLMGRGAHRAAVAEARRRGQTGDLPTPIIGCDGLPDEGQVMVESGELAATVVVPLTTPAAIDLLIGFWQNGVRGSLTLLSPRALSSAA
jgi:ABC-type sugar transport system substrate-binding protein